MTTIAVGLIVAVALAAYIWFMLRRLGIGQPGGKPDCGCGSGNNCKTHRKEKL